MTQMDWLLKLCRISECESLEKIIEKKRYELNDAELTVFWSAVDHRLAELVMNRLYARIPKSVWQFVV